MNYSGSIRIKKPETLQRWIDRGWYQEQIDNGYMFNPGCGRFRTEKCTCSMCRKKDRKDLVKILERK